MGRQPGIALGERKLVGNLFKETRATEIGERVVSLFKSSFGYGAREIKFPIERLPLQRFGRDRDRFREIAAAILDRRDFFCLDHADRPGKEFLTTPGDGP